MGKLIGWIKSNLLIVVFTVVAVLMIPGAFVGSNMWNKKIQKAAQDEYQSSKRELDNASTVIYQLPAVFEGEETINERRAPNPAVTEFYKSKRENRTRQVTVVVESAVDRNRGTHEVLLPELLPNQSNTRVRDRLTEDFAIMLLGRENQASVYKRLLDRINAGEPMEGDEVAALVGDYDQSEREKIMGKDSTGSLTIEQQNSLSSRLVKRRLGVVAQRANDISVYADVSAILNMNTDPSVSQKPIAGIAGVPSEDLFRWQWDYWVVEDILGAIAIANSDATGPTGVPDSVVKRIDRISIQSPDLSGGTDDSMDIEDDPYSDDPPASASMGSGIWGQTHTGRTSESPEGMDVRMVRLEVVISTSRLPRLFEALGQQNFMTVTSVKIKDIESWNELEGGFYFGPEHVATAVIDIETVWLREWTKEFMPDDLRETLGIAREIETDEGDEG